MPSLILTERVWPEIIAKIDTVLGLSSSTIITKATKWIRFDWRELLSYFEESLPGIEPPWCLVRPGISQPTDWGMQNQCLSIPVEIFLIESERNIASTTVTTGATSATQTVGSTADMFVGQRLWFVSSTQFAIVLTVDSSTQVTLTASITTTTGESVVSEIQSDVEVKIEKLRAAFAPGSSFTNFQIVDDVQIDVSDFNPANDYLEKDNFSLFAGSIGFNILVGETN